MGNLGRFQFVAGRPIKHPGKCVTCGSSSDKDYVDFGVGQERYGVIYICLQCFRAAASELLNLVPVERHDKALSEIKELRSENNDLRNAVAAFTALRDALPSLGAIAVPVEAVAEESSGEQGGDPVDSGNESESDGSSDEQGSPDVRNDDSVDNLLASI